jgi:hypothetical protein
MMQRYRDDLAALISHKTDDAPLRMRLGEISSVETGTVTVTIGGSATAVPGVRYLDSYSPTAADVVIILQQGAALVVLGVLA